MGIKKEGVYAGMGIVVGLGVGEVLKGVEIMAPGTSQTVVELLKAAPFLTPVISWAGIRTVGAIAEAISGDRPPTGDLLPEGVDYTEHKKLEANAQEEDAIWGGRYSS